MGKRAKCHHAYEEPPSRAVACGLRNPKHVTRNRKRVTCRRCRHAWTAEKRPTHRSVGRPPADSDTSISARVDWVEELLATGKKPTEVAETTAAQFGVAIRTAWGYLSRVYVRWEKEGEDDRPAMRADMDYELRELIEMAKQGKDVRAAVMALDRRAKLWGLDGSRKVEVSANVDAAVEVRRPDLSKLTREERGMMRRLLEATSKETK